MPVTVIKKNDNLLVRCPSHDTFMRAAAAMGVFDHKQTAWILPLHAETSVRQILMNCFGTDGVKYLPLVTVQVRLDPGCPFLQVGKAVLDGRIIARRDKADSLNVSLGWRVILLAGGFSRNGSGIKGQPVLKPKLKTLLEVREVPLHVATKLNRNFPEWLTIAYVEDQDELDVAMVDQHELCDIQRQREILLSVSDVILKQELERRGFLLPAAAASKHKVSPVAERARRRMFGKLKTKEQKTAAYLAAIDSHVYVDIAKQMDSAQLQAQHEAELSSLLLPKNAGPGYKNSKSQASNWQKQGKAPGNKYNAAEKQIQDAQTAYLKKLQKSNPVSMAAAAAEAKKKVAAEAKKKLLKQTLAGLPNLFSDAADSADIALAKQQLLYEDDDDAEIDFDDLEVDSDGQIVKNEASIKAGLFTDEDDPDDLDFEDDDEADEPPTSLDTY